MFSFENGPEIEMVLSVSEFLGNTPNIWDDYSALLYYIGRRMIAC
jgi:hypothetical protein